MVEAAWSKTNSHLRLEEVLAEEFVQALMERVQADPVYVKNCSEWSEIQKVLLRHDMERALIEIFFKNISNETVCVEYLSREKLNNSTQETPTVSTIMYNWLNWIAEGASAAAEEYWEDT